MLGIPKESPHTDIPSPYNPIQINEEEGILAELVTLGGE
jgi:hypothetical protein